MCNGKCAGSPRSRCPGFDVFRSLALVFRWESFEASPINNLDAEEYLGSLTTKVESRIGESRAARDRLCYSRGQ